MKLVSNRVARVLGVGLLAGGALIGTVSPAQATPVHDWEDVNLCAQGNYTAYAKIVSEDGSLSMDLPRVAQGTCLTTHAEFVIDNPNSGLIIYIFGIYNTTGKGFDVCAGGGAAEGTDPDETAPFYNDPSAAYDAAGTTTRPYLAGSLGIDGCAPGA